MALIALPSPGRPATPPLSLAYIATLLEQRRHIVRIYDLGLDPQTPLNVAFQPLRLFRPQVVVVTGEQEEQLAQAVAALRANQHCELLSMQMSRSGLDANNACASVLDWIDHRQRGDGPQPGGAAARTKLSLDDLPFPARHLLSLESYSLRAPGGELQTTLLVGCLAGEPEHIVLRTPAQIVAELRSVAQEFGLRHFLIPDVPLTIDQKWLVELLTRMRDAHLGISWEASVDIDQLDEALIPQMVRAGCEMLTFQLDAGRVFESADDRARLRKVVAAARQSGIFMRAHVKLEPPYESVPQLVDVAATFGLDDVRFDVVNAEAISLGADGTQLKAIARQIYDAGRDRERFISRFGPAIGNLIWKLRGPRGSSGAHPDDEGLTAS